MKIVSWNVNGLRACINNGLLNFASDIDADILCLQETKTNADTDKIDFDGYYKYTNYADKKGYSGTAVFSKKEAISKENGFYGNDEEGRIITLEYEEFYLINCYSPHSRRDLSRIEYKDEFTKKLIKYTQDLMAKKSIILCGDLNVAHQDIDLKNFKGNRGNAGFTDSERDGFADLLSQGLIDTFRYLYPYKEGAYTWWSYRKGVRERNIGWRIDYILISQSLKDRLRTADVYSDVFGSDHCPVGIEIEI